MINGSDLCKMSLDSFKKKVPKDPDDLFWTHLELLRKCKFVGESFFYFEFFVVAKVVGKLKKTQEVNTKFPRLNY